MAGKIGSLTPLWPPAVLVCDTQDLKEKRALNACSSLRDGKGILMKRSRKDHSNINHARRASRGWSLPSLYRSRGRISYSHFFGRAMYTNHSFAISVLQCLFCIHVFFGNHNFFLSVRITISIPTISLYPGQKQCHFSVVASAHLRLSA